MPETPAFLAQRLQTEGEKTLAHFEALAQDAWNEVIYSEGEPWTVRSIFAHFLTAEQGFLKLLPGIQQGGSGAPDDFDLDRYNASQQAKTRDLTPPELLARFRTARAEMVAWVASLSESDLQKQGRHPFIGVTTLAEMIKMIYRHHQLHLRDMRRHEA